MAIGVAGTVLAARQSDAAGAAFAIASQVTAMLFLLFRIIGAGVSVVVTQKLGAQQEHAAQRVARAVVGASSWLGGVTALAGWFAAQPLLRLLNTPAEVMPLALPLLQALALAMLFDAWNAAMASVMRAHLRTRDTLLVLVGMHVTHLLLALPMMFGWGPLPPLGLPGYALALTLSRMLGLALHLTLWRYQLGIRLQARDWWQLPRAELAAVLHIGLPGAAENIAWRLAFMVSVAAAAQLGATALATQAYVLQVMAGVMMYSIASGLTVEIIVGYLIGAGQLRAAHQVVRRTLLRSVVVALLIAALAALLAQPLLRWFSSDGQIVASGTVLLWLTVLLEPGRTFNLVVINALRAAGDARFPVMAGALSMLLVLAGGSWLLGVVLGWGLPGVWLAYAADEWIRGLIMWRRWQALAWVPHARHARKQLQPLVVVEG